MIAEESKKEAEEVKVIAEEAKKESEELKVIAEESKKQSEEAKKEARSLHQAIEEIKHTNEETFKSIQQTTNEISSSDAVHIQSMKQSIEQISEEQEQIIKRVTTNFIPNEVFTEMKLRIQSLEHSITILQSLTQNYVTIVGDVQALNSSTAKMETSLASMTAQNNSISSQMNILQEDWESRQQALLKEFTLIKTEFDRLIMPLNGASSSKSSFKKKEVEAVALSLDVLREDEKNLKERVVEISEETSERIVNLSQQIEAVKVVLQQLEEKRNEDQIRVNARVDERIRVVVDTMEQLRNLVNEQYIGKVISIKKKEDL